LPELGSCGIGNEEKTMKMFSILVLLAVQEIVLLHVGLTPLR
jgi:hypothetical protein